MGQWRFLPTAVGLLWTAGVHVVLVLSRTPTCRLSRFPELRAEVRTLRAQPYSVPSHHGPVQGLHLALAGEGRVRVTWLNPASGGSAAFSPVCRYWAGHRAAPASLQPDTARSSPPPPGSDARSQSTTTPTVPSKTYAPSESPANAETPSSAGNRPLSQTTTTRSTRQPVTVTAAQASSLTNTGQSAMATSTSQPSTVEPDHRPTKKLHHQRTYTSTSTTSQRPVAPNPSGNTGGKITTVSAGQPSRGLPQRPPSSHHERQKKSGAVLRGRATAHRHTERKIPATRGVPVTRQERRHHKRVLSDRAQSSPGQPQASSPRVARRPVSRSGTYGPSGRHGKHRVKRYISDDKGRIANRGKTNRTAADRQTDRAAEDRTQTVQSKGSGRKRKPAQHGSHAVGGAERRQHSDKLGLSTHTRGQDPTTKRHPQHKGDISEDETWPPTWWNKKWLHKQQFHQYGDPRSANRERQRKTKKHGKMPGHRFTVSYRYQTRIPDGGAVRTFGYLSRSGGHGHVFARDTNRRTGSNNRHDSGAGRSDGASRQAGRTRGVSLDHGYVINTLSLDSLDVSSRRDSYSQNHRGKPGRKHDFQRVHGPETRNDHHSGKSTVDRSEPVQRHSTHSRHQSHSRGGQGTAERPGTNTQKTGQASSDRDDGRGPALQTSLDTVSGGSETSPDTDSDGYETSPDTDSGGSETSPDTNSGGSEASPDTDSGDSPTSPDTDSGGSTPSPDTDSGDSETIPDTDSGGSETTPDTDTGSSPPNPDTDSGCSPPSPDTNSEDSLSSPDTDSGRSHAHSSEGNGPGTGSTATQTHQARGRAYRREGGLRGTLHTAVLDLSVIPCLAGTGPCVKAFSYQCGDPDWGFSLPQQATVHPPSLPARPTLQIAVVGDVGLPQGLPTIRSISSRVGPSSPRPAHPSPSPRNKTVALLLHNGDIAYADVHNATGRTGDFLLDYMNELQAVAARVPYMTAPGNHEHRRGFSAYRRWLPMPRRASRSPFWFSFDYLGVHVLSFSTEHALGPGSEQRAWMERDLQRANVNRGRVPWVVAMGHRPLYCSSDMCSGRCHRQALRYRRHLEPLLQRHGVDVVVAGHNHQFERTFPVYRGLLQQSNYTRPTAPVYVVNGAAGNPVVLDPTFEAGVAWRAAQMACTRTGYLLLTPSATRLQLDYVLSGTGRVVDSFTIVKT